MIHFNKKIQTVLLNFFIFVLSFSPATADTFLLVAGKTNAPVIMDSVYYYPYLKLADLSVLKQHQKSIFETTSKNYLCKSILLPQPIDSVLRITFNSSRRLTSGVLCVDFEDTCKIKIVKTPTWQAFRIPLKELNLFSSNKIIQDEIYIDIDLFSLKKQYGMQIEQILLFEFLFQQFLQNKIARQRSYSESLFIPLFTDYHPIYEPEIHFYLDKFAALALIKNWEHIKSAFKKEILSQKLPQKIDHFRQRLNLMQNSTYNRLIGFCKLFFRYGNTQPLKKSTLNMSTNPTELKKVKEYLNTISDHLYLIWFKPGMIDDQLKEKLQFEIENKKMLIFQE